MRTRSIEMYIGIGSDFGTWSTEYVEIPADTPEDKIEEVAKDKLKSGELSDDFQFCGVYSIPELDDEINTTNADNWSCTELFEYAKDNDLIDEDDTFEKWINNRIELLEIVQEYNDKNIW